MKLAIIWVLALWLSGTAHARDIYGEQRAAARQLFNTQIAALQNSDGEAFARTFVTDAAAVRFPSIAIATQPPQIALAVRGWLGAKPSIVLIGQPTIGIGSNAAYVFAELAWTRPTGATERVRLTELIVGLGPDRTPQGMAMLVTRPVADKLLVGEKPATKPAKVSKGNLAARMTQPKLLLAELEGSGHTDALAVLGSAPNEHAFGQEASRRLLGKWKSLKLTLVGEPVEREDDQMMGYALGQVSMSRGGGKLPITYDVLLIGVHDMTQDGRRPWYIVSVHYGAARAP